MRPVPPGVFIRDEGEVLQWGLLRPTAQVNVRLTYGNSQRKKELRVFNIQPIQKKLTTSLMSSFYKL